MYSARLFQCIRSSYRKENIVYGSQCDPKKLQEKMAVLRTFIYLFFPGVDITIIFYWKNNLACCNSELIAVKINKVIMPKPCWVELLKNWWSRDLCVCGVTREPPDKNDPGYPFPCVAWLSREPHTVGHGRSILSCLVFRLQWICPGFWRSWKRKRWPGTATPGTKCDTCSGKKGFEVLRQVNVTLKITHY